MKKCPQCAQVFADDLNFCLNDGATLVADGYRTESETPTVLGGQFAAPPTFQAAPPSFQQPVAPTPETPRRTGLWVGVVLGGLLLLGGAAAILGVVLYNMNQNGGAAAKKSPTPAASPSPSPTPTVDEAAEAVKRDREKLEKEKQRLENDRKQLEKQKQELADGDVEEDEPATALIVDPPTNIRERPNGRVICVVREKKRITILGATGVIDDNGSWYFTDACGPEGVVHSSQIRF